jgi:hypothetical protein
MPIVNLICKESHGIESHSFELQKTAATLTFQWMATPDYRRAQVEDGQTPSSPDLESDFVAKIKRRTAVRLLILISASVRRL